MQPLSFANTDGFLHFYSGSFTETRTERRDKRSCKMKNRGIPEPQSGHPCYHLSIYSPQYAIASISTSAAFGRAATSNAALAGHAPSKKVA